LGREFDDFVERPDLATTGVRGVQQIEEKVRDDAGGTNILDAHGYCPWDLRIQAHGVAEEEGVEGVGDQQVNMMLGRHHQHV